MRKEKEKRKASKRIILSMLSAALFSALILSACGRGTKTDAKAGSGQDEGTETKVAVVESSGTEVKAEAGQNAGTEEKAEAGQNAGTEGKAETGQNAGTEEKAEAGTSDAKQQPGDTEKVDWDDFCGQWVLTGFEYGSTIDDDKPSADHTYYLSESERDYSQLLIYNEENKLYADYYRVRYGSHTINGMALVKKEASPEGEASGEPDHCLRLPELRCAGDHEGS